MTEKTLDYNVYTDKDDAFPIASFPTLWEAKHYVRANNLVKCSIKRVSKIIKTTIMKNYK